MNAEQSMAYFSKLGLRLEPMNDKRFKWILHGVPVADSYVCYESLGELWSSFELQANIVLEAEQKACDIVTGWSTLSGMELAEVFEWLAGRSNHYPSAFDRLAPTLPDYPELPPNWPELVLKLAAPYPPFSESKFFPLFIAKLRRHQPAIANALVSDAYFDTVGADEYRGSGYA